MKSAALALALGLGALTLTPGLTQAATIEASFWDADRSFASVEDAIAYAQSNAVTATFESTSIDYPRVSTLSLAPLITLDAFIGAAEAASIVGDGDRTLQYSVFHFRGVLDLAPGTYNFSVNADDGFRLILGGNTVAEQSAPQSRQTISRDQDVAGQVAFDLYYYENSGRTGLTFAIDGDIVDENVVVDVVPLPGGLPLMAGGLGGLMLLARRR